MANARSEVNALIREINGIINELTDISYGLKSQFKGIGTEKCAASIDSVVSNCRSVKSKLQNMNMNKVTDSWAAAHSAPGSSGGGFR